MAIGMLLLCMGICIGGGSRPPCSTAARCPSPTPLTALALIVRVAVLALRPSPPPPASQQCTPHGSDATCSPLHHCLAALPILMLLEDPYTTTNCNGAHTPDKTRNSGVRKQGGARTCFGVEASPRSHCWMTDPPPHSSHPTLAGAVACQILQAHSYCCCGEC